MTVEVSVVVPTFNRPAPRPLPGGSRRPGVRPVRREIVIADDAAAPTARSRSGGAGVLPSGPTIHYLPVRRTVRPPPAMPGGAHRAGEVSPSPTTTASPAGMACGRHPAIRDGATGVSGRVVVPLPRIRPTTSATRLVGDRGVRHRELLLSAVGARGRRRVRRAFRHGLAGG